MALFQEIAFNEDIPVIHARRKDRVVVIATRVPLKDMLPERWGWILTLGGKGEIIDNDDIEALHDNIGRRYPKVYLRADMLKYIELWGCIQWEAGYSDGKAALLKENGFPDMKQFKEDLLYEITKKYQIGQEEQVQHLQVTVETQAQRILDNEQQKSTELQEIVRNQIIEDDGKLLKQMFSIHGSNQQHWDDLEGKILEEVNNKVTDSMLEQHKIEQKIEDTLAQLQRTILERIEQQPHLSEQDLNEQLDKLDQKQSGIVKDVQERLAEIKDILAPIDLDTENAGTEDEEIKKLSKNVKTLSERYITSLVNLNTRYYSTFDKEMKDSFKLTHRITSIGFVLFAVTIISLLVTFFFHANEIALITNGLGAAASAIAMGIGGWNKIHDDAANRQLKALANLSNSVKATHAQFIIEQVQDEAWQKPQFERLLVNTLPATTDKAMAIKKGAVHVESYRGPVVYYWQ